jgi:hypothetical protein
MMGLEGVPAVRFLEALGREFARPEVWAYLGFGAFSGYALGRFAKAVVPWVALFYLGAVLTGHASPEVLFLRLYELMERTWAFLSGPQRGPSPRAWPGRPFWAFGQVNHGAGTRRV